MHLVHKIVAVDDGAFATLHLARWQVNHAVCVVVAAISERIVQLFENFKERFEMVDLLGCDDVDHLIHLELVIPFFSEVKILRDIDRRSVPAQQDFLPAIVKSGDNISFFIF